MKYIKLTNGGLVKVDNEDYPMLVKFKWHTHKGRYTFYARTWNSGKHVYMHRLLSGNPKNKVTDHINRNGLDNRRKNLRICSHAQNLLNGVVNKNNTSGFKGVYHHSKKPKWCANIGINGKKIYLGYFDTKKEAAIKYQEALLGLIGVDTLPVNNGMA